MAEGPRLRYVWATLHTLVLGSHRRSILFGQVPCGTEPECDKLCQAAVFSLLEKSLFVWVERRSPAESRESSLSSGGFIFV